MEKKLVKNTHNTQLIEAMLFLYLSLSLPLYVRLLVCSSDFLPPPSWWKAHSKHTPGPKRLKPQLLKPTALCFAWACTCQRQAQTQTPEALNPFRTAVEGTPGSGPGWGQSRLPQVCTFSCYIEANSNLFWSMVYYGVAEYAIVPLTVTVEARKLEHSCPHTLKVKYKGS